MSKKTLQDFIAHSRKAGLVLGSHFYVEILNGDSNGDIVGMYCESTNLPGINIATADTRIFGENRTSAYMPLYPDLNLTFIVDGEMRVLQFFEEWLNRVVDRSTRTVGYYNDYINDMNITVTDKMGNPLYKMICREVFPKSMSDIRFDSNNREFVKLDVNFAMKYWEVDYDVIFDPKPEFVPQNQGILTPSQPSVVGSSFNSIINKASPLYSGEAQRSGRALSALTATGPLSSFGSTMDKLGQASGKLSTAMSGFSQGLSNITAPIAAVSNAMNGISSTLGTLNTVTSALGLGTPFSGAQAAIIKASGTMAAVSTLKGLPGAISGVGSSVSSVGAAIGGIVPSIGAASNGSKQIMDSVKQMGTAFSGYGNKVQESAGSLQTQINRGDY
jgi:hypothetical protein